jgi:sugar-specific transcriptional regulator TrmB
MSTQARQTVKQVFNDLKAAQHIMKTEGQDLAKESRTLLKQTGAAALTLVETFAQNAGPVLSRVETEATDLHQTLTKLWDIITNLAISQAERTWRIVTKEGVQSHLQDMLRRARTTITLVYPSLEEVPLDQLVAMPANRRLHLITTIDRTKDGEVLQKLQAKRNIRIWHAPKTECYAGSRDGEEVLIAPTYGEPEDEEVVAVASDHGSYVALFSQSLAPRWISGATEIVK